MHLLQAGVALAAPLGGHVDGVQALVEHRADGAVELLAREAVLLVAGELERQQVLVAVAARALADLELLGGEGEVHGLASLRE